MWFNSKFLILQISTYLSIDSDHLPDIEFSINEKSVEK